MKKELTSLEHGRFKNATPAVKEALRSSITSVLNDRDVPDIDILTKIKEAKEENRPYIICMLGINGTGKTTTMAKLANLELIVIGDWEHPRNQKMASFKLAT